MVSLLMLIVGNIPFKQYKTITYNNVVYKDSYLINNLDIITVPETKVFDISDEIKRPNDESSYVFIALIVGLAGFVITKVYLNHIN